MRADKKSDAKPDAVHSGNQQGFKKKNGKKHIPDMGNDYFKDSVFWVGNDGPDLYEKTIDCLTLYESTRFKNSSDMVWITYPTWEPDWSQQVCMGIQNEWSDED